MTRPIDGEALRARREELGLSLEEVAERTRIPVVHLRALEEGRPHDLPAGPFVVGWVRAYLDALDLDGEYTGSEPIVPAESPTRVPMWGVRAVAVAAVALLVGMILLNLVRDGAVALPSPDPADRPSLDVVLDVRQAGDFRIVVDDRVVLDKRLPPGDSHTVHGRQRVVVEVPGSEAATVRLGTETIVPQGRQDVRRRLVFVDDVGGAP